MRKTVELMSGLEHYREKSRCIKKMTNSDVREFERKCRIGHIEREQKLGVRFVVTSDSEI